MLIQLVVSVPTMYNAFIFCTNTTAISFFYISICDNVLFSPIFHPIFARFCYRREDDLADSACYKRLLRKRYWAFPRKVCARLRFWVRLIIYRVRAIGYFPLDGKSSFWRKFARTLNWCCLACHFPITFPAFSHLVVLTLFYSSTYLYLPFTLSFALSCTKQSSSW